MKCRLMIVKVLWSRSHYYVKKTTTAIAAVSADLKNVKRGESLQNCAQDKGRGGSRGGGNRNQGGDGDMVR